MNIAVVSNMCHRFCRLSQNNNLCCRFQLHLQKQVKYVIHDICVVYYNLINTLITFKQMDHIYSFAYLIK